MLQLDQVARSSSPQSYSPSPTSPIASRTNSYSYSGNGNGNSNTPRLPPRPPPRPSPTTNSNAAPATPKKPTPPPLPRRKTSRSSLAESVISVASTSSNNSFGSNTTTRSLPPVYTGKESLPVQFPDKKRVGTAPLPGKRVNSLPPRHLPNTHHPTAPAAPTRPPLPVRRTTTAVHPPPRGNFGRDEEPKQIARRLPPLPTRSVENSPVVPGRPQLQASHTESEVTPGPPPIPRSTRPPPIPVSSRPSLSPATTSAPPSASPLPCLICYDFSGPDYHAGLPQFHRSRVTSIRDLAIALTEPFPSALEKARALFIWFHHNVSYDVHSFLAGNIPPQKPDSVLHSGLAVCQGYADLFAALALHCGLEAIVVGGHGKGYGYSESAGPPPPYQGNHAWNAVKLAPNYWHLIDPCWGAGHIQGPPTPGYTAKLNPAQFTSPPSVFGRCHFPENPRHQYREDGRTITWEEYMAPEVREPKYYSSFSETFNFTKETILPATKQIAPGGRQRFAVTLPCQHLPVIQPEDEYVLFLNVGNEFNEKNFYLLEPDGTGRGYQCVVDIPRERDVKVTLYHPTQFDGREGKGLSREYFKKRVGKCGWGWSPIVEWGGSD